MQTTANYALKKPEDSDTVKIEDLNDNADTIDAELKKRALITQIPTAPVQSVNGKTGAVTLSSNDIKAADGSTLEAVKEDFDSHKADNTTETKIGHIQLATVEEVTAGTEATKAVTPKNLKTELNKKIDLTNYQRSGGYAVTSGTSIAYAITLDPAPTAYADGQQFIINPHVDCGITPTLNVNGLGDLTIVKQDGSAISAGDIEANKPLSLVRVGSNFFIRSSSEITLQAGDTVLIQDTNTYTNTTRTKYKYGLRFNINYNGSIRLKFSLKSSSSGCFACGRIYKNGVAVGTEQMTYSTTYVVFTQDFTCSKGDYFDLYLYGWNPTPTTYGWNWTACGTINNLVTSS